MDEGNLVGHTFYCFTCLNRVNYLVIPVNYLSNAWVLSSHSGVNCLFNLVLSFCALEDCGNIISHFS